MFLLGSRNHFDDVILMQSHAIEKPGADWLGSTAYGNPPLLSQVELVVADFFRA